jgi:hypothetical protein
MEGNVTLERLDDQLAWYSNRARANQQLYKRLKVLEIAAAALVPVAGASGTSQLPLIAGLLGALIVVLEGIQHVYQYQSNWIGYRATAEGLKREKYLHAARAGAYAGVTDRDRILAERIEEVMAHEQTKWVETQDTHSAAGGG